ncbi:unnamed protein product [Parnassius apollo]|uniref:(apollo) hypothetical protein n=1 Tax=Parnassius apollo TaxID=110799 RepID=A0A8S3WXY6_PARAO|nr:unnamed protein product [Parnassius apollo]
MVLFKDLDLKEEEEQKSNLSSSKKRRLRRKKLWAARNAHVIRSRTISNAKIVQPPDFNVPKEVPTVPLRSVREEFYSVVVNGESNVSKNIAYFSHVDSFISNLEKEMSSKDFSKSREDVLAAREEKKLSKQKAKKKCETPQAEKIILPDSQIQSVQNDVLLNKNHVDESDQGTEKLNTNTSLKTKSVEEDNKKDEKLTNTSLKGKDEVDRAIKEENKIETEKVTKEYKTEDVSVIQIDSKSKENTTESSCTLKTVEKTKEQIKAERIAKKAAKQAKKKIVDCEGPIESSKKSTDINIVPIKIESSNVEESKVSDNKNKIIDTATEKELTVRDVVETLKDIVNVSKEVQAITDKVKAIDFGGKKSEETAKSKAELKAERRAKQEAQRAAKQAQQKSSAKTKAKDENESKEKQKQSPKPKSVEKPKPKTQSMHRVNWFQHLYTGHDKEALKKIALNSNLHPAVIKLGVQLACQVVTGSNARCIALLDALKKMVRDYSLPAKTEFARGLESHLAASLEFLWAMRQPSASQTNAVKHFRRQLTQLPNNVDEFDAKKTLQEEIDRYIREQIDMAGEAISIAVRYKISNGDNILTYGCSSLIERILCEAWESGVRFRTVVVGARVGGAREMLRRLAARALPATYADITAVSFLMPHMNKVILGAGSLLMNGSVLGAVGSAQVALVARSCNVPVLVACETHKFSERVQTDAFVYNELGDPDDLIDKTDENSPLKDWRSNPNLTLLNLTYDVTPPSLVTAVVTELAILPCTSAPVVLRFKLSEYGM